MKARIIVTNDQGVTFEGTAELVRSSKSAKTLKTETKRRAAAHIAATLSFSLNPRAFMSKYAKDRSGSRKFTLLLARLAQGKTGEEISGERVVSAWNRMKGVMGGAWNPAHANTSEGAGLDRFAEKGVLCTLRFMERSD
jgi:hypothetical protein